MLDLFLAPRIVREAIADCFEQDPRSTFRRFDLWPMRCAYIPFANQFNEPKVNLSPYISTEE